MHHLHNLYNKSVNLKKSLSPSSYTNSNQYYNHFLASGNYLHRLAPVSRLHAQPAVRTVRDGTVADHWRCLLVPQPQRLGAQLGLDRRRLQYWIRRYKDAPRQITVDEGRM